MLASIGRWRCTDGSMRSQIRIDADQEVRPDVHAARVVSAPAMRAARGEESEALAGAHLLRSCGCTHGCQKMKVQRAHSCCCLECGAVQCDPMRAHLLAYMWWHKETRLMRAIAPGLDVDAGLKLTMELKLSQSVGKVAARPPVRELRVLQLTTLRTHLPPPTLTCDAKNAALPWVR
jgi:hypothetical protein